MLNVYFSRGYPDVSLHDLTRPLFQLSLKYQMAARGMDAVRLATRRTPGKVVTTPLTLDRLAQIVQERDAVVAARWR